MPDPLSVFGQSGILFPYKSRPAYYGAVFQWPPPRRHTFEFYFFIVAALKRPHLLNCIPRPAVRRAAMTLKGQEVPQTVWQALWWDTMSQPHHRPAAASKSERPRNHCLPESLRNSLKQKHTESYSVCFLELGHIFGMPMPATLPCSREQAIYRLNTS